MNRTFRLEAQPRPLAELAATQRAAHRELKAYLRGAIRDLRHRKVTPGPVGAALPDRQSRILFLSGDRGTGKTTVYLTLRKSLRKNENLVWLEPLDMELLPSDANLLAAVLVRIDQAVHDKQPGARDDPDRRMEESSLLDQPGSWTAALRGLSDLLAQVAIAWYGNLPKRSGQLDPDNYSIETERSERARLSANRKFTAALDKLATAAFTRDAVFVLPVDDLDLNPEAAVPLLRMLRMVSNPRLVTLVLGNWDVLQRVAELQFAHDLAQLGPGTAGGQQEARDRWLSADIGRNSLRKHLPPSQRVDLLLPTRDEALAYTPAGGRTPLSTWLEAIQLTPVLTAAQFFTGCDLGDGARSDYSGSRALSVPMRHLADLYADLEEGTSGVSSPESGTKKLEAWLLALAVDGLQSSAALSSAAAADLEVQLRRTVASSTHWHLSGQPLRVDGEVTNPIEVPLATSSPNGAEEASLVRVSHRGWRFTESSGSEEWIRTPVTPLNEEFAARLIAFHDLARQRIEWAGSSMLERLGDHTWALTRWMSTTRRVHVDLPWPVPPVTTFWRLEAFLAHWSEEEVEPSDRSDAGERLAFAWIAGGTAAVARQPLVRYGQTRGGGWPALRKQLELLDVSRMSHRRWLQRVVELAMPEFGLPSIVEHSILTAPLHRVMGDQGLLRGLQDRRRNRLGILRSSGLFKSDMRFPPSRWPDLNVEPRGESTPILPPDWARLVDE